MGAAPATALAILDCVYSWGVLHDSPNTPGAIDEVWRVLRPGGVARIMIYRKHALVGTMLWLRYGLLTVADERIFFVGNTMIDTLLKQLPRLRPPGFWGELGLRPGAYFVVTLHRPANVDGETQLIRAGSPKKPQ